MPKLKWTLEASQAEALKYATRGAFRSGSPSAYTCACAFGYLDSICAHMAYAPNIMRRFVYEIASLEGNAVYVGITYKPEVRYVQHQRRGSKAVRAIISGPHKFALLSGMIDVNDAVKLERDLIADYLSRGFDVANRKRGGELGYRRRRLTKQDCLDAARKHKTLKAFRELDGTAHNAAMNHGWLQECCMHLERRYASTWTLERCQAEAAKYATVGAFTRANKSVYNAASREGRLGLVIGHLARTKRQRGCAQTTSRATQNQNLRV